MIKAVIEYKLSLYLGQEKLAERLIFIRSDPKTLVPNPKPPITTIMNPGMAITFKLEANTDKKFYSYKDTVQINAKIDNTESQTDVSRAAGSVYVSATFRTDTDTFLTRMNIADKSANNQIKAGETKEISLNLPLPGKLDRMATSGRYIRTEIVASMDIASKTSCCGPRPQMLSDAKGICIYKEIEGVEKDKEVDWSGNLTEMMISNFSVQVVANGGGVGIGGMVMPGEMFGGGMNQVVPKFRPAGMI